MIKKILVTVALGLATILTPNYFVHADNYSVSMQVLENGTNNTSYAAAYFANSATVTTSETGYTVTSTITTDTSLGNYPVQMLSVDGAGVSTSKSQSGNQQTLTYSFHTSNLSARHNANIRVDVDSINYHHNYTVGLVLDSSSIPTPTKASVTPSSSISSSTPASTKLDDTADDSVTQTTSSSKPSSISNDATSSSESSLSSTSSSKSSSSSQNKKITADKAKKSAPAKKVANKTPLPIAAIIGGGLVIGIAGAVALNLLKKK